MSADSIEDNAASGRGMRARYLPVSRKELRRRREAELSAEQQDPIEQRGQEDWESDGGSTRPGAFEVEPDAKAEPESAGPEPEVVREEESTPSAEPDDESLREVFQEPRFALFGTSFTAESTPLAAEIAGVGAEADAVAEEEESAPIPASRRGRRLLAETEPVPAFEDPELLAEIEQVTGEISKNDDPNHVDPELLKKQQALAAKAMQANQARMRHMQQNTVADSERRRGRERPESEVIADRALRDSYHADAGSPEFHTSAIEPIGARGAHGLELNEMLDQSSRMVGKQNMLLYLVIILAALLVVFVVAAVVIYFFVL